MCLTNGIFFINHSPIQKTVEPTQEDTNIPTRSINTREVKNPRPEILSKLLSEKNMDSRKRKYMHSTNHNNLSCTQEFQRI